MQREERHKEMGLVFGEFVQGAKRNPRRPGGAGGLKTVREMERSHSEARWSKTIIGAW